MFLVFILNIIAAGTRGGVATARLSAYNEVMKKTSSPGLIILFVVLIITVGQITTDIYLPSLPDMTVLFQSESNIMQLSLTVYLATFGLSQLFYGPLSDRYGRRKLLFTGMGIYTMATVVCALAADVPTLLAARAVQGMGIGCGAVVARAISRDMFTGMKLAKATAYISLAMSLSPAIAPAIGGYMHVLFGWQSNFVLLTAYASILFLTFYFCLPETMLKREHRKNFFRQTLKDYKHILTFPLFLSHGVSIMINFGSFMAYQTVAPFLLQNHLGLNPAQSGQMVLFVALGYGLGTLLSTRLVERLGINCLMLSGLIISVLAALSMWLVAVMGHISLVAILLPMGIFTLGSGLFNPGAMARMLTPFPQLAATASACMGALITIGAGLLTFIVALLPDGNQIPLASLLLAVATINIIVLTMYILPNSRVPSQHSTG